MSPSFPNMGVTTTPTSRYAERIHAIVLASVTLKNDSKLLNAGSTIVSTYVTMRAMTASIISTLLPYTGSNFRCTDCGGAIVVISQGPPSFCLESHRDVCLAHV